MNDYELTKEAESLAREIWKESQGDEDAARELAFDCADGHAVATCVHDALQLCATCNTAKGESWLVACGCTWQPDDTLDAIVCRVAFAEIYHRICAALTALSKHNVESSSHDSRVDT